MKAICKTGEASMSYLYFDFCDANKQHWRDLAFPLSPTFLLIQLLVTTFKHIFTWPMALVHDSPVMIF